MKFPNPQVSLRPRSDGIARRDFLNGLLIGAGGLAIAQSSPFRAFAAEKQGGICEDVIGDDPRVLRSGNVPASFNIGHWMRDRRLKFDSTTVTIAPGCDAYAGEYEISEDSGEFDVIILGGGLAGLSSAFYLLQERPGIRILILEANGYAGGNAARDDGPPLPVAASTAGAYAIVRSTGYLADLYKKIGVEMEKYLLKAPYDCYFLDENCTGVKPGSSGWQADLLLPDGKLRAAPFSQKIIEDLARTSKVWNDFSGATTGPKDPPDESGPQFDYLSQMTLADYLTNVLHCDPAVVDFYSAYTIDCLGGTAHSVNAHSAIAFLAAEYSDNADDFACPGGNAGIASKLVKYLTDPDSARGRDKPVDIRLDAIALKVGVASSTANRKVDVIYFKDEKFHRTTAKAMIVATQSSSTRHLIEDISDDERKAAWNEFNTVPAVVANVAVRDMTPFVQAGLGYANHFWGSRTWANFEIADWTTKNRLKTGRASVLTFYGGVTVPPEEIPSERMKLLKTPFADYEKSLRDDLSRVMRGTSFDFDRDVSAVFVYRWGHSMMLPTTKSVFGDVRGANGQLDRSKAPRRVACRPLGSISFAGQHTEGNPSVESALASGHRAAGEVLSLMG